MDSEIFNRIYSKCISEDSIIASFFIFDVYGFNNTDFMNCACMIQAEVPKLICFSKTRESFILCHIDEDCDRIERKFMFVPYKISKLYINLFEVLLEQ